MGSKEDSGKKVSKLDLAQKIDECTFENTFFNKEKNNSYGHFSSVIKEIKDGEGGTSHLVKIRPPLFYLNGILSNLSRLLSSTGSRKILDNRRWSIREKEYLKSINPDFEIDDTVHENAILMEKIDGEVAYDILTSDEISGEEKLDTIQKISKGLRAIHQKNLYHGEPNTQNCLINEEGEIYWIDFEIEYHQDLSLIEKKAKDLEQMLLSMMGAFEEEEKEIDLDDEELIDFILESYGDQDVISHFLNNAHVPFFAPYRIYQLAFSSAYRFYQVQLNLMKYLNAWESEI
ncbi:MAG: lipopolysaccharide kinase InaA family protein [Candidatus Thermoplasmatota archaeon]